MTRLAAIAAVVSLATTVASTSTLQSVVEAYALTENYPFAFPSSSLDSSKSANWLIDNWKLNGDRVDWGTSDITFTADPAGSPTKRSAQTSAVAASVPPLAKRKASKSSSSVAPPPASTGGTGAPVLRIEYPAGSYSAATGGTQFYAQPLNASKSSQSILPNTTSNGQFERMLLSYDIFFSPGFQFNLGGKLPGLRGGPDPHGCSGGHQADGMQCFSTRLMWREHGDGEVYAYVPTTDKNFCSQNLIHCNSDYGTSVARGSFSLATGTWQTIWLYVALNQDGIRNGVMSVWYNGVKAFELSNLELRRNMDIASIGGLYFSTFFGGYDASWASPQQQYTYFRNMQIYAGLGSANGTGSRISGAQRAAPPATGLGVAALLATTVALVALVY